MTSSPRLSVASFDVFDTVLTRAIGAPEDVFLLLGCSLAQDGAISCSPEVYHQARVDAESRAYEHTGPSCTLDTIYRNLSAALQLSPQQAWRIQEAELALEETLIQPVPGAAGRIAKARGAGQRVVFLSDMYLSSQWIVRQLQRFGLWQAGDSCYVSCEWGKDKRNGGLFEEMLAAEKVAPQSVIHLGNSAEADLIPAKRLGLQAEPFLSANLNRFEIRLDRYSRDTEGLAAALAGASRMARLSINAIDAREAAIRDVVAGVTAPVLTGYVLWILQRAAQLGIRRLYFLSRDGQVLLAMAERLKKALNLCIDLRYLYGSRQSWNLPAVLTASDAELAWIWDSPDLLSARSLLARVGLAPEQARDELAAAGLAPSDWSRPLRPDELAALRKNLLTSSVRDAILEQAKEKRALFLAYLKQEGVFDEPAWGLVDLGWYGSMQNSISAVLNAVGASLPVGFYIALFQGAIPRQFGQNREAYFFDEHAGTGSANHVPDIIAMMEMFTVSDQGTVIEYQVQDAQVLPVLKEPHNQKVLDWGLPLLRETLFSFLDHLVLDESLVNPFADTRDAARDVLQAFWTLPAVSEARAWASFPWEDGLGAETYTRPLAEPFTWKDVWRAVQTARVAPHHRAGWMAGSLALTPAPVCVALQSLARLFHLYRSWRWRVITRYQSWHKGR